MNAGSRLRALGALGITVSLVTAGCQAGTGTPSPSPLPATPTATASAPSASAEPTLTPAPPEVAPTATAVASPAPSPEPPVTPARCASAPVATPEPGSPWVPAGALPCDWDGWPAAAVPLPDGGALVLDIDGTVAQRWDPVTNAWHEATPLNASRTAYAAAPLRDGRVLVTGGLDRSNWDRWQAYSSTYLYDPSTPAGTWTKVGLLGTARVAPAAAVLPDGRVLVAGGAFKDGPPYGATGSPGITLAVRTPAGPGSGAGGGRRFDDVAPTDIGVALATAELFDPATGRWSSTGSMRYARAGAVAVTLADGRVLVVGPTGPEVEGENLAEMDPRVFGTAEVYDPGTGRFSLVGSLPPIDRAAFAALGFDVPDSVGLWQSSMGTLLALPDGGALLVGHSDSWKHWGSVSRSFRFDSASGRWRQLGKASAFCMPDEGGSDDQPCLRSPRTPGLDLGGASAAVLPGGLVLVAGGTAYDETGAPVESQVARLYDPETNRWSRLPPTPLDSYEVMAVALADGSVLVNSSGAAGEARAVRFVPSP